MKKLTFIIFLLLCVSAPVWCAAAEEAKQPGPWSLEDCIEAAMQNQVDVLTARNDVTIARSRSDRAISDYFPQLSIQNNAFTLGSTRGVLSQVSTGTALTVNQNVFDGGLREASAVSARYGIKQNQAGLTRTVQTVAYTVTRAYYDLLRARHLAEVARKNVEYNEGLRDQVKAMAKEGESAAVDVLPVEAQLANARVSLLSAQNSVRTAAIQLQNQMGLAPQPGFDIREVESPSNAQIEALDMYVVSALKDRPDVLERQAGVGSARAEVRSARLSLYPRPVISGQYQQRVSGGFTSSATQIVGGFVFDILNGGANRAAYREAEASRANAELQLKQIDKDIRAQVEEAYLNLTNANERVTASAVSLEAAEKNYEAQKGRYSQGLGTTLDLLNAEVQVVTAQSNDVQARYDYYTAIAQVDYATGSRGETAAIVGAKDSGRRVALSVHGAAPESIAPTAQGGGDEK